MSFSVPGNLSHRLSGGRLKLYLADFSASTGKCVECGVDEPANLMTAPTINPKNKKQNCKLMNTQQGRLQNFFQPIHPYNSNGVP